ncbi:MAG: hypothetical protein L6R35_002037 [Caloplaca aegaea]|nr:MAG: hypothetical protein L6R35_002037 [Caloplaca aegaea]
MYFHPLARYPGPRLAVLTGWYETYFDCVRGGQFSQHIDQLHLEYGNIIRINPGELHIRDPRFFDRFYTSSSKLDIDSWYYNFAGIPRSTFATSSAALHRQRRSAIAKAFASSSESERIEACTCRLIGSLQRHQKIAPGKPVLMSDVFLDYVDNPGSAPQYGPLYKTLAKIVLWNRHFGRLFRVLSLDSSIKSSSPPRILPRTLLRGHNIPTSRVTSTHLRFPSQRKPPRGSSRKSSMIIGAGNEAVGAALSITTYHLLPLHPFCII